MSFYIESWTMLLEELVVTDTMTDWLLTIS